MLTLKNVSTKNVRLKYRLPATKYFSMEFPESIKLCPGISVSVPITFRPVKREQYDDFVEFITNTGGFAIPIRATLPVIRMQVPDQLDFGYVASKDTGHQKFAIKNTGEVGLDFAWNLDRPFTIKPAEGHLEPGESMSFEGTFQPQDASVFVASAVCLLEGNKMACMKVTGIGKYPFISLEQKAIDFGEIVVGQTRETYLRLSNHSLVPATFNGRRGKVEHDGVFTMAPMKGRIPPGGKEDIKLTYTPQAVGTFTSEEFVFTAMGGNTAILKCQGTAMSTVVSMSADAFNFGSVKQKESASRVLYIKNHSDVPVPYQFIAEYLNVFSFDTISGFVAPHSQKHVTIKFEPTELANYWKRVTCLFGDRSPLYVDLVGTCFNDKHQPVPLAQDHINAYLLAAAGGAAVPKADDIPRALQLLGEEGSQDALALSGDDMWEQFFHGQDPADGITLDKTEIEFGSCSRLRMSEYQVVTVANNTDHKVTAFWAAPGDPGADCMIGGEDDRTADGPPVFKIFPEASDIKPRSTAQFRIQFRPPRDSSYFVANLDCFAFVKSQRNFRLVTNDKVMAPWCVQLRTSGHTFVGGVEEFLPKATFPSNKITFPPCHVGETMFLTTKLTNTGDTPVKFDLQGLASKEIFQIKPHKGVVPSGESQIIGLRFHAKEAAKYTETIICTLNNSTAAAIELSLTGTGYVPKLIMDGMKYFKPTCVGASSKRELKIVNPSRIPVVFDWSVPERLAGNVIIQPAAGMLRGNESTSVQCIFAPTKKQKYQGKIQCQISSTRAGDQSADMTSRMNVTVVGEGISGTITLDPTEISFDTVCIGQKVKKTLTLLNQADGILAYELEILDQDGHQIDAEDLELTIDAPADLLPARAYKTVTVTFAPVHRASYHYQLMCKVASRDGSETYGLEAIPLVSASVQGSGSYPLLQITDVFSSGGAQKSFLWEILNVNALNAELGAVLTEAEEELYEKGKVEMIGTEEALRVLEPISCRFGFHGVGNTPSRVTFELTNTGALPAEFKLHFMDDAEVEIENWVDVGEPKDREGQHHAFIIENSILDIQPQEGELSPGESVALTVTYQHTHVGYHELPVLLHVGDGKRIRIHLDGETIAPDEPRIDFPSSVFELEPVALGSSPVTPQSYCMFNNGPVPVRYSVDTASLAALNAENFDFPVLTLKNPEGVVPIGGSASLVFEFLPVEEKEYEVDVVLSIAGGPDETITVRGRGLYPRDGAAAPSFAAPRTLAWDHFDPRPTLELPVLAQLSAEHLTLGPMPVKAMARRLIVIRSQVPVEAAFAWRMHNLKGDNSTLRVEPEHGVVEPYGTFACRVSYTAGTDPQRGLSSLECVLNAIDNPDPLPGSPEHKAAMGDETLALDPPPLPPPAQERTRLSVTLSMTSAVRSRIPLLDDLHQSALQDLHETQVMLEKASPYPLSQRVFVGLDFLVVTEDQYRSLDPSLDRFFTPKDALMDLAEIPAALQEQTQDLMDDIFLEALCDPEVALAIEDLDKEETPYFAELGSEPTSVVVAEEAAAEPGGELAGALQQKGFQELAEYVLESAIFAILQESAHS